MLTTEHPLVKDHRGRRSRFAEKLRRLRAAFPDIARTHRDRYRGDVPFKPTSANFRKHAEELIEFSKTPIRIGDGEYYSRCGYEDGQAESRNDAREFAEDCLAAARSLEV